MNKQQIADTLKEKIYRSTVDSFTIYELEVPTFKEIEGTADDIANNIDSRYGELLVKLFESSDRLLSIGENSKAYFEIADQGYDVVVIGRNEPNKGKSFARSVATSIILNDSCEDEFGYCYPDEICSMYNLSNEFDGICLNRAFEEDFAKLCDEARAKAMVNYYKTPEKADAEVNLFGDIFACAACGDDTKLKEIDVNFPKFYATSMALIHDIMVKFEL